MVENSLQAKRLQKRRRFCNRIYTNCSRNCIGDRQCLALLGYLVRRTQASVECFEKPLRASLAGTSAWHKKESELYSLLSGVDSALTGGFKRNLPRDRPKCYGCGYVGHIHRYCPSDSPKCFSCGDVGHMQGNCPRKRKWLYAKIVESDRGILTSMLKMFMPQHYSWRLLETVSLRIKNAIHGWLTRMHQFIRRKRSTFWRIFRNSKNLKTLP